MSIKKFGVIDCETDPFNFINVPEPFIWGFYDGKKYKYFFETKDLVKYIKKFNGNIYAHNGGKFDHHYLIEYAEKGQKVLIINGRLSKWKLGKATMLDSFNILPVALAKLQKDKFDYWKMAKENRQKYMPEIMTYLEHDCVYLWKHIKIFIDLYGQNITLASAAFKFWKEMEDRKSMKIWEEKFSLPRTNQKYYLDFMPFYFGGRVTPFQLGHINKPFKIFDINSAYPYVMKKYNHPLYGKFYRTITPPKKDDKLINCFLKIKCKSYGALPERTKSGIDFPYKQGEFYCTGFEFIAGLKTNTIKNIDIKECYVFESFINFTEYIDYFYEIKNNSKKGEPEYIFSKLMMNALYGKFASNPARYKEYIFSDYGERPPLCEYLEDMIQKGLKPICKNCEQCDKWSVDHGVQNIQLFFRQLPESKQNYYNICTSASITGAVRAYLWENIHKVKNPYYCDTDSIICEKEIDLKLGNELGEWDNEGEGNELAIAGKKLYAAFLNTGKIKIACKGVNFTGNDIKNLCKGYKVVHKNLAPTFSLKKDAHFIERKIISQNNTSKNPPEKISENFLKNT